MPDQSYNILSIVSTYVENFLSSTTDAKEYVNDIFKARDNSFKNKALLIFENLEQIRNQNANSNKNLKEKRIESLSEELYNILSKN